MKETSLGDEALQGLEEAIRSESPGIEIVDFLGWRVFVEAKSVPIYVRGLADGALMLRSPLGTLVEAPDQYLKFAPLRKLRSRRDERRRPLSRPERPAFVGANNPGRPRRGGVESRVSALRRGRGVVERSCPFAIH